MTLEQKFNRIASFYDWIDSPFERFRYRPIRKKIWSGLTGRILDAGVGTGCNIPFYPSTAEVVGVDLSERMLRRAEEKAMRLGRPVVVLKKADICRLPFADRSFDAVVATFLCCVVEDPVCAARELRRVCKTGGPLIFLEYVLSEKATRRLIQKAIRPYTRFLFGADFTRDTEKVLRAEGFRIERVENLVADILKLIVARAN